MEIIHLTFQLTLGEILELNCAAREQRIKAWVIMLLGVGQIIAVWLATFQDNQLDPMLPFLGGCLFLLLGLLGPWIAGLGGWFRASRAPCEIEIVPEGVVFLKSQKQTLVPWDCFSRWFQTKNLLVLIGAGDSLAIPKRSCWVADWEELLKLVQKGLGNPSRW